jgi:hypothetical protein
MDADRAKQRHDFLDWVMKSSASELRDELRDRH